MTKPALIQPPAAIEAEQSVLGGLMLRPEALTEISDWLHTSDFFRRDHQLIFDCIVDIVTKGEPVDAVTLGEWFEANGVSSLIGGSRYVLELANSTPSAANIVAYAEIVLEKSRLRQAMDVAHTLSSSAMQRSATSALVVAEAMNALARLTTETRHGGLKPVRDSVKAWFQRFLARHESKERMTGVVTPFHDLNEATLGLQPGEVIILAARPSMGKSALGHQIATFAALRGVHTAEFSLEMRAEQLAERSLAAIGTVPHVALRDPSQMQDEHWPRLTSATTMLKEAALHIDDEAALTAQQIVMRAKRQNLRQRLGLIVIDHLHEVRRPGKDKIQELGDAVRAFKAMAKQLHVPVLLLAQLNRSVAGRADPRPTLSDLRESGSIEEVGDVIFFLHRQEYYDRETHLRGVAELILGKGRDLPAGHTIYLASNLNYMRFDDWVGALPERPETRRDTSNGLGRSRVSRRKPGARE
jgi:replicative DNA helicase